MLLADLLRRAQALVRVRRRHADVDERDVRRVGAHLQHQLVRVPRLADDLEAAVLEQTGDAFAQEDGVLRQDDAQARFSRFLFHVVFSSRSRRSGAKSTSSPPTTSCRIRSGPGRPRSSCVPRSRTSSAPSSAAWVSAETRIWPP